MREPEVEAAFVAYLRERGWDATTENADHTDVIAKRGAERIVAEVKGPSSVGTDLDTLYGQLLRRMSEREESTRYAPWWSLRPWPLLRRGSRRLARRARRRRVDCRRRGCRNAVRV